MKVGIIKTMAAMIGHTFPGTRVNEVVIQPSPQINPALFDKGFRDSYRRSTSSGRNRTRSKNRLQVSKATKRKHRKAA